MIDRLDCQSHGPLDVMPPCTERYCHGKQPNVLVSRELNETPLSEASRPAEMTFGLELTRSRSLIFRDRGSSKDDSPAGSSYGRKRGFLGKSGAIDGAPTFALARFRLLRRGQEGNEPQVKVSPIFPGLQCLLTCAGGITGIRTRVRIHRESCDFQDKGLLAFRGVRQHHSKPGCILFEA